MARREAPSQEAPPPGLNEIIVGAWFDRRQEYAARRRREDFRRLDYATRETLVLDPLPCWKHLPEEQRRRLVQELSRAGPSSPWRPGRTIEVGNG